MGKKGKVYYVCFYAEHDNADKIVSYPSVWSKIDYVASVIKDCGYCVELVSEATAVDGKFRGYKKRLDEKEEVKYFSSRSHKNLLARKLSTLCQWGRVLLYLLTRVKKEDTLLVYHSVYNLKWLQVYHDIFRRKFSIEIEDVYSALNGRAKHFESQEWKLFAKASTCLCVNDIIANKINDNQRKILSYGSYLLPKRYEKVNKEKIRLVYAGVIEQERNAAFLAVETMRYLPDNYELSILGFGNSTDIKALANLIDKVKKGNNIIFWGRMEGDEYYSFLQNCDIGLSTHVYDDTNMESADHTFPSKILVYLSNGLSVVAQRLECLEKSAVNDVLCYYDIPEPKEVANAIMKVNLELDSRGKIRELGQEFKHDISQWLVEAYK